MSLGWTPVLSFTPPHDEVIVPQPVTFHPDDDIWVTAISPIPSSFARLYLPDADDAPAGSLHGHPDEDFWANQVAPVAAYLYQSLPYRPDPDEISAGDLFGQPDEDFWINPVNPVVASLWQPFPVGLYFESDAPVPVFGELSANVSSMALALDATIKHESRSLAIPGGVGNSVFILITRIASSGMNNTLTVSSVGNEIILSATSLG